MKNDCVFCKIVNGEIPCYKVFEDEHTLAFLDINPMSECHTLVVPKKHFENMFDISENEVVNVIKTVKKIVNLYSKKLGISDVQVFNNSGKNAQQDVFHLHFHIVPRMKNDRRDLEFKRDENARKNLAKLFKKITKEEDK